RWRGAACVGDGEIETRVRGGAAFEIVAAVASEVLIVPPEARADGDVITEEIRAMQEGIDHEEASERLAHKRAAFAGAIVGIDERDHFGGYEVLEAAGAARLRGFGGVGRRVRAAGGVGAAVCLLGAG